MGYFHSMHTVARRKASLRRLSELIQKKEDGIYYALEQDLGKPRLEAYASEIAPTLDEIKVFLKNLSGWSKRRYVSTKWWSLGHFMARSFIQPTPLGRVLIISPWNYPFQLAMIPLIGAVAAGNKIVLKPSEFAPQTSRLLKELIYEWIDDDSVKVVEGDASVSEKLCREEWGMIFFTGGTEIGRKIMESAAKTLSPVTLELGGKSPCILDKNADLKTSLRRILWGKCFNAGQTCVAPDYLLVPQSRYDQVLNESQKILKEFYPQGATASSDYGRIVNKRHFDRLISMTQGGKVVTGGEADFHQLKLAPTILTDVDLESSLMRDEIFGPLLPVIPYQSIEGAIEIIRARPYPLALYLFSNDRMLQEKFIHDIPCGGICLNDVLVHLSNPHLPFGGIRTSGIGAYHGKKSFEIFSHWKSVERKNLRGDLALRYPPYKLKLTKFLKKFV